MRPQINKIRNEKEKPKLILWKYKKKKTTIIEHYKQLYANKFNIVGEMDNCLGTHNPPKLNQEEIDNLNRLITKNEIEYMIKKKTPYKQKSRTR